MVSPQTMSTYYSLHRLAVQGSLVYGHPRVARGRQDTDAVQQMVEGHGHMYEASPQ